MEQVLGRAFNQSAAAVSRVQDDHDPVIKRRKVQRDEEHELRSLTSGMSAADAIKRILLAQKDKDYFRCCLPQRAARLA